MLKSQADVALDLAAGRLVGMLPEWRSPDAPIYALFPSASRLPLKTRVLLDALSRRLRPELMGAD